MSKLKFNPIYKGVWALGFTVKEMATAMYKAFNAVRKQAKEEKKAVKIIGSKIKRKK